MDPARFTALEPHVEALRTAPGFDAALARYCRAMTSQASRGAPSLKLFHRLQRYLVWLTVIANHQDWLEGLGEPPTLSLLQARSGLSQRQVSEIAAQLAAGRQISAVADRNDGRRRLLVPRDGMVLTFAQHLRHYLDLHDAVGTPTGHVAEGAALLSRMIGRALREAPDIAVIVARYPRVYRFAAQDCGYHVLCAVMLAAMRRDAEAEDAPLSLSGLAGRLQVSKSHVGAMLADAREAGLFRIERGQLAEPPALPLVEEFGSHAARNALYYADMLRRSLEAAPEGA